MRNYESDAYGKYRSSMEQRQKVVRTSGSPYSQQTAVQGKRQIAERSASTKRKRTREKGKPYASCNYFSDVLWTCNAL